MLVDDSTNIYAGQTEIIKAYQGNTVIYEKSSPSAYTELDNIRLTGTQYYDTGLSLNHGFQMDATLNVESTGSIIGAENDSSPYSRNYLFSNSTTRLEYGADNYYMVTIGEYRNTKIRFEFSNVHGNVYLKIDGVSKSASSSSGSSRSRKTLYIGNLHGSWNNYITMKIYDFKLYNEEGTLVRDYIPVLDSNNLPCLYDKLNNTYTYHSGTGNVEYTTK